MKALIDEHGQLALYRNKKWKLVMCPYNPNCKGCGDWCAQFTESSKELNIGFHKKWVDTCLKSYEVLEDKR